MSERNPFEPRAAGPQGTRTLLCEEWEALLADALDGSLPPGDAAAFQAHQSSCAACLELLTRARQGQEWLQFLHPEPEIPSDLVAKILASTTGAAVVADIAGGAVVQPKPGAPAVPFWKRIPVPPAMRRMAEPRLMMTAAMAFFSIALTLNLAGVRLTAVRISDLKPSSLRSNLSRQIINSKAGVVRYYDNLRFVYEMEAKMRELRRATESEEPAQESKPKSQTTPPSTAPQAAPQGSAHKNGGKSESPRNAEPRAMIWGRTVEARLQLEPGFPADCTYENNQAGGTSGTTSKLWVSREADQAERSLA